MDEMSLEWRAHVKLEGKSFSSVSGKLFLIPKYFLVGTRNFMVVFAISCITNL